ncbi:uncharacterized protein [Antedon mediterranea]|uniref:uncharacterized protein n=1 Tax=Antedon mediterranea TaxID=105859 RepID=UPI003AF6F8F3
MSLTSMYPMKKKRKRTADKTPIRRTRRNWDAISPMATSFIGTPSPNNSSIDADKDIIWDNCSPTQHLPMRLRTQGRQEVSDIAQFIKLVPAENAVNVEQKLPPLLGLWMERGHDVTDNFKSSSTHRKVKVRKPRSKIGHLKSDVFSSELCKLAKMMENRQDSPVARDKMKLRSNVPHEIPESIFCRTSTPNEEKTINFINRKRSLNGSTGSSELWGQDEWFEDESILQQATQIEQVICSQINNEKTQKIQPIILNLPSDKTPVTRKMKGGGNVSSNKFKPKRTNNLVSEKTENKPVCNVPTIPLKPRQLHGTFQKTVRVKSEEIDVSPNNLSPVVDENNELWDDLDDNELDSVFDSVACKDTKVDKPAGQRSNRVVPTRKCFRFKSSEQVEIKPSSRADEKHFKTTNDVKCPSGFNPGGSKQLAFQKLCSPVTRSMTRNRITVQKPENFDLAATNNNNNNPQCSQEQIEQKRLLALQRRKNKKQPSKSQINQRY